jgi:2-oxoglutarate/2-oxoacid ferredoxin oxidoreductase subunit beta
MTVTIADYNGLTPAWCPGCGNFGILAAVKKTLVELNLDPHNILLVSGIGQAGKLPHYTKGNVFNSLHGRPLPPAIGAKLANSELIVIAISGDGDGYGEGGNHFIHAARRNHDITYLVHNNQIYGLTKGQTSPTSDIGFVTKTTPQGAPPPINPITLAIAAGASFVARAFAGDIDYLSQIIKQGINHRGFALIDILQPCVSFNHKNTYQWYKERVYKLEQDGNYDPSDKNAAFKKAQEWGEHIPTGVFFREDRPTYESEFSALRKDTLVSQPIEPLKTERLLAELF